MIPLIALIVFWFSCGCIAAGLNFAYFQRKFARIRKEGFDGDRARARIAILLGPMALGVDLIQGGTRYGWLWPWSDKAKREAGVL